jgi:hypothetical protein
VGAFARRRFHYENGLSCVALQPHLYRLMKPKVVSSVTDETKLVSSVTDETSLVSSVTDETKTKLDLVEEMEGRMPNIDMFNGRTLKTGLGLSKFTS